LVLKSFICSDYVDTEWYLTDQIRIGVIL